MDLACYRLDTARQSLVFAVRESGLPEFIYWAGRLPDHEDLPALAAAHLIDITGGMLDANSPLSILPEARRSFPGQPGLALRQCDDTAVSFCGRGCARNRGSCAALFR